jgi:hypothetical protein
MHDIPQAVVGQWVAAAPVVVFGAPIGAYLSSRASRTKLLYCISALCVFQFLWALKAIPLGLAEVVFVAGALTAAVGGFALMYQAGKGRQAEASATYESSPR